MTVFAVQMQMRFDPDLKELVPRFPSINKASKWGEIVYLLSPTAHPFDPPVILGDIHGHLSGFSDDDHLLLIGNPALIGMATAIAGYYNKGNVKFLQWSGRNNTYIEIVARMF